MHGIRTFGLRVRKWTILAPTDQTLRTSVTCQGSSLQGTPKHVEPKDREMQAVQEPLTKPVRAGRDYVPPMPSDYRRPDIPNSPFALASALSRNGATSLAIANYLDSIARDGETYARSSVSEIAAAIGKQRRMTQGGLKTLHDQNWIRIHPVSHPNQPWTLFWLGWRLPIVPETERFQLTAPPVTSEFADGRRKLR